MRPTAGCSTSRVAPPLRETNTTSPAFTGIPFGFEGLDQRLGWVVGGGVDWAFYHHWSLVLEYDYYQFGHHSLLMSDPVNAVSGPVDFKQSVQIAKLGLNFHMWNGQ